MNGLAKTYSIVASTGLSRSSSVNDDILNPRSTNNSSCSKCEIRTRAASLSPPSPVTVNVGNEPKPKCLADVLARSLALCSPSLRI